MNAPSGRRRNDFASRVIQAPPHKLYRAFLDGEALVQWLPPRGMTGKLEVFEPREGGIYRMVLTYEGREHGTPGKSTEHADIVEVRFLKLEPDRRIVQGIRFDTTDPTFAGIMTITWTLTPVAGGGTEVSVLCANVPEGIGKDEHDRGLRSTLHNLAVFAE